MHCLTYFKLCVVSVQCLLRVFCVYKKSSNHVWLHLHVGQHIFQCFSNFVRSKFSICLHVAGISSVSEPFHKNISNFVWAKLHLSCCFYFCHQEHLELSFSATYVFVQKLNICCKHISQFSDDIETFLTLFVVYFPITARNSSLLVTN